MTEKRKYPGYVIGLARRFRRDQTAAEELLWHHLRDRRLSGAKFRRQHPIGRYIADFYCDDAGLIVELVGAVHEKPDRKEYDRVRQHVIEAQGIGILTFSNDRVLHDIEGILAEISVNLSGSS